MDVWVVVGYAGQVHGVYTTEKGALIAREHMERDGIGTLDPVHMSLNKDHHEQ